MEKLRALGFWSGVSLIFLGLTSMALLQLAEVPSEYHFYYYGGTFIIFLIGVILMFSCENEDKPPQKQDNLWPSWYENPHSHPSPWRGMIIGLVLGAICTLSAINWHGEAALLAIFIAGIFFFYVLLSFFRWLFSWADQKDRERLKKSRSDNSLPGYN